MPLMAKLPGRSFTAFDLPGHGESEFDKTLDIQAQAVSTAIHLLETTGPSDVFGHSFGATVALKLAMKRPDLVRRLSLYEPVYFSVLAQGNPEAYAAEARASASFTRAAEMQDWPAAARAFLGRWSLEPFDELPLAQQKYILKTIPLIMASSPSVIAPESGRILLAELEKPELPILLMEGGGSPKVISEINALLARNGKNITRKTLTEAGHMGAITHAGAVASLMADQPIRHFPASTPAKSAPVSARRGPGAAT